ncbi:MULTISPECIES: hypothetical protein [Bradyrhizobium]|uniref:Uncharacterized protein n=1 Tax=Bradyrhizobium manausense TaxID=989370 RepID=A0A0R3D0T7_9BRAD|nr:MULTISPECIES: hypothetical protein [Bradyrhizobium]KRQ03398.1 hypothetical protein AOQ71_32295 [Bradyrhizobium manausense]MDA9410126.1 hypothetical protein [Bradyrhizobium sp. CCBAU 45384]MDA9442002.1 hypothetical protein [Bradyrhizobium sp. CCBAU 51745]
MVKAPVFLLLSLALAGCAVAPQAHLASDPVFQPARYAWDGAGENPNQQRATERATRIAAKPAHDGTDADQDAKVNRSLVICQGCLPAKPQQEDARLAKATD